jgi:hypothetical protein
MHSIRIQLLAFIAAVLLIFLVILNIYPLTSSRDLIFEEKRSAISSQVSVIASSLSGRCVARVSELPHDVLDYRIEPAVFDCIETD